MPKKPAAIEWPCELSLALRNALVEAAKVRSFDVGEHFLMGKGTENGLCYLVRGLMEVRIHQSQKSSPFAIFKGGGWFGGTTFDEEPDFLYQISAIESAELLFVPDGVLRDLAERNTEIFKLLYRVTAHHANSAIDLLFASSSMPAPQKLAYFIWRLSLSFSKIPGATPMIPMPQGALAELLGMSRLTVNQYLHTFEQAGVISLKRKSVYVANSEALKAIAGLPGHGIDHAPELQPDPLPG